jgi:hypothetical protein
VELHRAELHRAELHRAELHRAELHRAELHRAELHRPAAACYTVPGSDVIMITDGPASGNTTDPPNVIYFKIFMAQVKDSF